MCLLFDPSLCVFVCGLGCVGGLRCVRSTKAADGEAVELERSMNSKIHRGASELCAVGEGCESLRLSGA